MIRILMAATVLAGLAASAAQAQEVVDRERNQQGRIAQGVRSGQLTARGTAHLEHREADINASRVHDLRADGGHLTPAQRQNLNARQNSVSHQIYDDKHNLATQPGVAPQ